MSIIGKGTYGKVVSIDNVFCNKIPKEGCSKSFLREINFLKKCSHKNIIEVFRFGETFFTMKRYKHTLMDFNCLPEKQATTIIIQILKGVSYINSLGFVHFDLKPDNVVINMEPEIEVRLIDFGAILRLGKTIYSRIGCAYYLAPEAFHTPYIVTDKMDIWSIGCIYYELITDYYLIDDNDLKNEILKENIGGTKYKLRSGSFVILPKMLNC